jgi:hypothetical protein
MLMQMDHMQKNMRLMVDQELGSQNPNNRRRY